MATYDIATATVRARDVQLGDVVHQSGESYTVVGVEWNRYRHDDGRYYLTWDGYTGDNDGSDYFAASSVPGYGGFTMIRWEQPRHNAHVVRNRCNLVADTVPV